MKYEIVQQWVDALRSGEYKQTKAILKDHNGYCCLGVLCDLSIKDGMGEWEELESGEARFISGGYRCRGFIPMDVVQWIGKDFNEETFLCEDSPKPLYILNDMGYTFEQIADLIEERYLN